jgi:hypothetical protein
MMVIQKSDRGHDAAAADQGRSNPGADGVDPAQQQQRERAGDDDRHTAAARRGDTVRTALVRHIQQSVRPRQAAYDPGQRRRHGQRQHADQQCLRSHATHPSCDAASASYTAASSMTQCQHREPDILMQRALDLAQPAGRWQPGAQVSAYRPSTNCPVGAAIGARPARCISSIALGMW